MNSIKCLAAILISVFAFTSEAQRDAEIFAPGELSKKGRFESSIGFMPNGKECYITVHEGGWRKCKIYISKLKRGKWSELELAPFSKGYAIGAWPSYDGKKIYYVSPKPKYPPSNIWMCKRIGKSWSEPVKMESPVSSEKDEWSAHLAPSGNLYFCSHREGGLKKCDIWIIKDGKAENIKNLNTEGNDCGPVTNKDETFMIFQSPREGGYGEQDLWISYKQADGSWGAPLNLGPKVNTETLEIGPCLSPDEKTLFFVRGDPKVESDIYKIDLESLLSSLANYTASSTPQQKKCSSSCVCGLSRD